MAAQNPLFELIKTRRLVSQVAERADVSRVTVRKMMRGELILPQLEARIYRAMGETLEGPKTAETEALERAGLQ